MNQRETSIWPQLEPWCILTHILHNLWMVLLSGLNPLFNHYGQWALFTVFGRPYTL